MYIDKSIYWLMLGLFGMIVFLVIIECTLKHTKFKLSRKNLSITICLIAFIMTYTFLFKFFHSDSWIGDYINSFVAMGTVALAIFGWIAYKGYWKQKKDATIYDRIIRSTSLMHTRILQFQRFIDNYALNATLHLNGAAPTIIPVVWLNDLVHDTNACLSGIKDFESVISEWEAELDYIHLFSESINKELITSKLEQQLKNLKKDLPNLFSQILKIKNQLLEYLKKAPQNSLSEIQLEVNPIVIKNISIQETETVIKDFIKQTIDTFS